MKAIVALCLALSIPVAAACNKDAARDVQQQLRAMATWQKVGNVIELKWGPDWDNWTPRERLQLVTVFADSDACLSGGAFEIEYYRRGKLVARASPGFGIRLVK